MHNNYMICSLSTSHPPRHPTRINIKELTRSFMKRNNSILCLIAGLIFWKRVSFDPNTRFFPNLEVAPTINTRNRLTNQGCIKHEESCAARIIQYCFIHAKLYIAKYVDSKTYTERLCTSDWVRAILRDCVISCPQKIWPKI